MSDTEAADKIKQLQAVLVYISEHGHVPADLLALVARRALESRALEPMVEDDREAS